ncbi:hypothetical protein [Nocardioides stalactiti]|uniref:hypothetical protein n=1 Tax=Nocardioides stalactiti TaxID=2755356 RepID=UPI0015FF8087|nr:hypothetical protein [Nocardioides stalactiti]
MTDRARHRRGVPPEGITAAGAPVPTSHRVVRAYGRVMAVVVVLVVALGLVMTLLGR